MNEPLKTLIEAARKAPQSKSDLEVQRRSFAYGNTHFENNMITRDMVNRIADEMPFSADLTRGAKRPNE
ncbi:hypothetical protein G6M70_20205 [Agrobacterium tumefaciens]|uniref:hypothetical protein n=1 Tax=Agrobacterium TaxID=357 RepID=UPI0015732D7A|nr:MULTISPECIES: hypothetical protein [Agrobacterium]MCZ7932185.1 hypothetical protein [Agrobacterium leguminum]NSY99704.1 hypothetical protein [Agrobacterium tumefaciens]NSZ40652.1 hypothetical protein [Agrobacterium tumefaciens]NTB22464.1 hypothetical protein [Agrobacterium tumefaciens]NTB27393.1 hypothetical protein [Agrobacterium tumefaciens]